MTLTVTALASGSNGNALLIQAGQTALLVDCGLSLKAIERYLRQRGVEPHDLAAVVLTHEHDDHSHSAGPLCRRYGLPLVANRPTLAALGQATTKVQTHPLDAAGCTQIGALSLRGFAVPHDAAAPLGFLISFENWSVGIAVDLGGWDETLVQALSPADLLIVEANHDRERLLASPYPWGIKQRIMSPLGHLDNLGAGELLARICADGRPRSAWLGHLSEQTNSPAMAIRSVQSCLRLAGVRDLRLAVAERGRPSVSWSSADCLHQQSMFALL